MKKINFKMSSAGFFSYIYSFVLILGLISLAFVSIFLYNNFYSTILTLSDIVINQENISDSNINMTKFNKVIEKLNIQEKDEVEIVGEDVLINNSE